MINNIIIKVINERKELLEEYKELEELENKVAKIKAKLEVFGTKENIEEDIKELEAFLNLDLNPVTDDICSQEELNNEENTDEETPYENNEIND